MLILAGKYELLRKLAAGGMAEVFLARQKGVEGFEKLVVVKRILSHLAENENFVRMFLDEARTAADLRHPNVVSVFEMGADQGNWFIAMEFLHGQNLRRVERAAGEQGTTIPLGHAVRMVIEAAHGLHYAHQKKDLRGKPLGIVHRDVSPQNIIVTYEGVTKIVDFGIAKAAGVSSETAPGMVRGKLAYMSPEQIRGQALDARTDVFSLALVLYELTTGKSVFQRDTDIATMQAAAQCDILPPSRVVPDYPRELEKIVLHALTRAPENRTESCGAFATALEDFLAAERIAHSGARVAQYLRELFGDAASEAAVLADIEAAQAPTRAVAERSLPTVSVTRHSNSRPTDLADAAEAAVTGGAPASVTTDTPSRSVTGSMLAARSERRTNLSAETGLFVGRTADLDALRGLFDRGERVVTVLGPGGAGKTRLVRRFGAVRLKETPASSSVWFCDLTEADGLGAISVSLGNALGIALTTGGTLGETVEQLGHALAARGSVLVILDNFEHVVAHATKSIGVWQAMAPDAQFLVTTRERLGVAGEFAYELEPLSLAASPAGADASDAVQLFVQRARAVRRDYAPDEAETAAITEIVRQLEGMPLAIELAAARVSVMSAAKLLERLPQRLAILSGSRHDAASRHATMRGTIDWSWNLLQPWEQETLAQCAVFRGGFDLEAAEAVVDLAEHAGAPLVLDVVQSLRGKSLLRTWKGADGSEDMRFGMYSNIDEYAAEKLEGGGRRQEIESRHATYYLGAATRWAAEVDGPEGLDRLKRIEAERENLAAVYERALAAKGSVASATRALRAIEVLEPLLSMRGPFGTHLAWLDAALAAAEGIDVPARLRAKVLDQRGCVRRHRGLAAEAMEDLRAARALAAAAGDRALEGRITGHLGYGELARGNTSAAVGLLEEARVMLLAARDTREEAQVVGILGDVYALLGRPHDARAQYVRALAIARDRGNKRHKGVILQGLGALLFREGKLEEARECHQRALAIAREFSDRDLEAAVEGTLAGISHEQGRFEEARDHFLKALEIHGEIGNRRARSRWLGNLAVLDHEQGKVSHAASRYARAIGISREVADRHGEALYLAYLAAAKADLDELPAARRAFAEARAALAADEDELLHATLDALEGHLEIASFRQAMKDGDKMTAAGHQDIAMSRMRAAQAPSAGDAAGEGPSFADRSEDVRHAVRLLRRTIQSSMSVGRKRRATAEVKGTP